MIVYLVLGSNVDPERNLRTACRSLGRIGEILRVSTVYQSPPQAGAAGGDFLNAGLCLRTELDLPRLRKALRGIEEELGRSRPAPPGAPRTIDLDLVLGEGVTPHPDLLEFAHAAAPIGEILPAGRHPQNAELFSEIARGLEKRQPLIRRPELRLED